jgi:predicted outer membrane protein
MNTKALLAIAALAAAASTGVRADEADASQYVTSFEGSRSRAEVQAEAAQVARNRSNEPAGSRIAAPIQSTVDTQSLRAQTAEAVRLGQISHGEAGGV